MPPRWTPRPMPLPITGLRAYLETDLDRPWACREPEPWEETTPSTVLNRSEFTTRLRFVCLDWMLSSAAQGTDSRRQLRNTRLSLTIQPPRTLNGTPVIIASTDSSRHGSCSGNRGR